MLSSLLAAALAATLQTTPHATLPTFAGLDSPQTIQLARGGPDRDEPFADLKKRRKEQASNGDKKKARPASSETKK